MIENFFPSIQMQIKYLFLNTLEKVALNRTIILYDKNNTKKTCGLHKKISIDSLIYDFLAEIK